MPLSIPTADVMHILLSFLGIGLAIPFLVLGLVGLALAWAVWR